MKIDQLLLCDLAFYSREGKLNLIGIFENILVPALPTSHSRICVVGFVKGEPNSKGHLQLTVNDPQGVQIVPPQNLNLNFNNFGQTHFRFELLNFPLNLEGNYRILVSADKAEISSTNLFIKKTGLPN